MKKDRIKLVEQLKHPLFFPNEGVGELPVGASLSSAPFFIYELSGTEQPWLSEEKGLPLIKEEWPRLKEQLERKFQQRDREVHNEAKAMIALFLMNLFWSNGQPVQLHDWKQRIRELSIKPVNVEERLEFIFKRPYSYHSYMQVSELMIEQEKQTAKYLAIKKKNKKDGL
ncbi:YpoC family protein [Pseudobacillus sp. FSL P4-0506]|uniref:YpoC family protein n=1 Tax=Pseudobacillus sp. FSL P4-0506 TaxID=2921576 RepID=UPI0030FB3886